MKRLRVLVTAGPTREYIDPVRFISNPSTGKMGFALAEAARRKGFLVTLVSGPVCLKTPQDIEFIPVITAAEMAQAVLNRIDKNDLLIMSAAVADFKPSLCLKEKIKKTRNKFKSINLEPTQDILLQVAERKRGRFVVGFAAETEDCLKNARRKLVEKNLDMIVLNDVAAPGIGFGYDTNQVSVITSDFKVERFPVLSKKETAEIILECISVNMKGIKPNE